MIQEGIEYANQDDILEKISDGLEEIQDKVVDRLEEKDNKEKTVSLDRINFRSQEDREQILKQIGFVAQIAQNEARLISEHVHV